jgi:molybdopterin-containing oxidoreductase family iron-sulfur binding subunit
LKPSTDPTLTLTFQPDAKVLDGRFANNPWLQELPHPVTQLVWDNAVSVSPAFAKENGLTSGDLVILSFAGSRAPENPFPPPKEPLTAAVLVVPGQASDCLTLSVGYGRSRAGSQGTSRGFNAGQLRTTDHRWQISPVSIRKAGSRYPLVTTQEHFAMEDRDPVRRVTPENLQVERPSLPSLYPAWPREGYAWAMSIDLSTCTGCKACVVACQAENNIPSVGKDQVARGREMHWLRVDRYYSGDPANPHMFAQPVPCMHCENAPCELVCPVAATVHSSEGLNDMIYNRCIGTRYCSNNCPYKVRRFNFLDYRASPKSPVHLQDNPDVTVRERGVMEKCTYCVQRINAARIAAEKENRHVRDGEIKTACQQACPVVAIVFGVLNDPDSRVYRRKKEPIDYALLAELNTRPRTTYLAKVIAELDDPFAAPGDDTRSTDVRQPAGDGLARIPSGGLA